MLRCGAALALLPGARSGFADAPCISLNRLRLEFGVARAQSGDHWVADFDRGGRRSDGLTLGFEAAFHYRWGPWRGDLSFRGRDGETLPARGQLIKATLGFTAGPCSLGVGRSHPPWVFCEDAGLLISHHPPPIALLRRIP